MMKLSFLTSTIKKRLLKFDLLESCVQNKSIHTKLFASEIQKHQVDLFEKEAARQESLIINIEKIRVNYEGFPENCVLMMNKDLSTPYDCALHLSRLLGERSALAEVDGEVWDICKPLSGDCNLKFRHFKEADPYHVNKAFWRSLSMMLGAVLQNTFKDELCFQPFAPLSPRVRSGSFAYDFTLDAKSWSPNQDEMRILSTEMIKLALENHRFQRLEVHPKIALKIFKENPHKSQWIEKITSTKPPDTPVVLYRLKDFIDINSGPLISQTGHMGKCTITAVHPIGNDSSPVYRAQGVALPKGFHMNHYTYSILEERARKLNNGIVASSDFIPNVSKSNTLKRVSNQV